RGHDPGRGHRAPEETPSPAPAPTGTGRRSRSGRAIRCGGGRKTWRELCGNRPRWNPPLRERSHAPRDLAGVSVVSLEPGDLIEHRTFGIDSVSLFECFSSLGDPPRSEKHEAAVELGQ